MEKHSTRRGITHYQEFKNIFKWFVVPMMLLLQIAMQNTISSDELIFYKAEYFLKN